MDRRTIQLVLVAALVAVAGCAGGMGGDPGSDSTTDDSSMTDSSDGGVGTAAFYISDEPNAIDDFQHLNVTITKVGFKKAGDGDDNESDDSDADDANETDDGDDNESDDSEANETDDGKETETDDDANESADETGDDGDSEEWIERDVDNATVDLTELKGTNASMIDEFELPAGDYEKVFIYVSDTEGVLTDGNETRVKLPSNKLQLNTKFTVGDGERVDFVYDIAPHKAGGSGKYILKPVISESGTGDDVEIRDIDAEDEDEEEDEKDDEETEMGGGGNDDAEEKSQND